MSAEERLAERRERLISAAYTLYSDPGFPETTIEKLCASARISNRAFYECFSGRTELMQVVHDRCVRETLLSVSKSIQQAPDTLLGRAEAASPGTSASSPRTGAVPGSCTWRCAGRATASSPLASRR
ncbi:TetR family transcriptional regulator [Streptosporangium lutulentum]